MSAKPPVPRARNAVVADAPGDQRVSKNNRIGFIGLGNVGASLAGNLLRHGVDLTVRDLDEEAVAQFVAKGAKRADSPRAMAEACDIVITCLPSPASLRRSWRARTASSKA